MKINLFLLKFFLFFVYSADQNEDFPDFCFHSLSGAYFSAPSSISEMPISIFSESPFVDDILNDLESDQTANFNTVYETLKRITKVSFVDQYESLLKVGQGTFGEVFKARNKNSKLFVAMKRIKTETEKEGVYYYLFGLYFYSFPSQLSERFDCCYRLNTITSSR